LILIQKGIDSEDCRGVSKLIGIKMFVNEFVAYSELGKIIDFGNQIRDNNTFEFYRNGSMSLPDGMVMLWNV